MYFEEIRKSDDMPTKIAKIRYRILINRLDINNVLNQLHIRSDEAAERKAKNITMELFTDVFPRIIDGFEMITKR